MQYTIKILIERDRETVVERFSNPENMVHWAEGFERLEQLTGEAGADGSTNKIFFKEKKRSMEIIETIESNRLPEQFIAIYDCGGVWNRADNRFDVVDEGRTRWVSVHKFRFSGFMKVIGFFFKSTFVRQTRKYNVAFKAFCERSA